jgi:hypothetical protein
VPPRKPAVREIRLIDSADRRSWGMHTWLLRPGGKPRRAF